MADQNWDYLLLKNGDKAHFTPPPPTSTIRGGILAEPATTADTQPVRIGTDGFLYTSIIRSSITVEVKTQDNVIVSGITVVARENDANGDEIASAQYSGQPVTLDVPRNIHYYIEVVGTLANHFGPNTVSGIASSPSISHIITYQDASNITTYKGVVEAVRLGLNDTLIGKEIADTWTDEDGVVWDDPSIVVHVGNVTDPEGSIHVAAIMQRKYASVKAMSFDAAEREKPSSSFAQEGVYYYAKETLGSSGWTYAWQDISTGASLSSLTDPVCNDVKDTNFSSNLAHYGWNNWQYSNIRQYLNSNATAGNWWQSSHLGDSVSSVQKVYAGWLKGATEALRKAIKPIQITSYGYIDYATKKASFTTVDTVFLPSAYNIMGSTNIIGEQWDYWKKVVGTTINPAAISARIFSRNGNKTIILRDSDSSTDNSAYIGYVTATGSISTTNSYTQTCFTPCFAIY